MQPSSVSRIRCSAAIRRSSNFEKPLLIRRQSAWVGVRPCGSLASSAAISGKVQPICWAIRAKDRRRMSERRKRRWPPAVRSACTSPFSS